MNRKLLKAAGVLFLTSLPALVIAATDVSQSMPRAYFVVRMCGYYWVAALVSAFVLAIVATVLSFLDL